MPDQWRQWFAVLFQPLNFREQLPEARGILFRQQCDGEKLHSWVDTLESVSRRHADSEHGVQHSAAKQGPRWFALFAQFT
jgi:hypothetical protein